MDKTFSVINLGCKVNAYEADAIAQKLEERGYERKSEGGRITLIFTCAVTDHAAAKSRQALHRARRNSPEGIVVCAGCYTQVDAADLEDADILAGTAFKKNIPDYLDDYLIHHEKIRAVAEAGQLPFDSLVLKQFDDHARGLLKVQDGCNQFCTYCIIPYARGRERSLEPALAVEEAKRLAQHHREIVLTGIHTGRYGREYGVTLAQLIERILREVPELLRIRISSIEMNEVDDDLIRLIQKDQRVARHLHIPLQSGSDAVLSRMGRPYDTAAYYDRIMKIRDAVPGISISTDLIVGFPGETESEAQASEAYLKKCAFSFLHVFPYSLRRGTRAAGMPCQVDPKTRKERAGRARTISGQLMEDYIRSRLGKKALLITEARYENGCTMGHTSEYLPVWIRGTYPRSTVLPVVLKDYRNGRIDSERSDQYEAE